MRNSQRVLFTLLLLLYSISGSTQIFEPVKWSFLDYHKEGNEYTLEFIANIDEGWAVYSQYLESEDGPIATSSTYEEGAHFELVGKGEENPKNRVEGYDDLFSMNVVKYKKSMVISQRVRILDFSKPIAGYLTFMTCNDVRCLPPTDIDFSFQLEEVASKAAPNETSGSEAIEEEDKEDTVNEVKAEGTTEVATTAEVITNDDRETGEALVSEENQLYGIRQVSAAAENCDGESSLSSDSGKSYASIFILGILGGFLALLTPCVFPLIPLTVSFFTKGSENKKKGFRNAILYGSFIFLVYLLLSVPFHLLDSINPDILNEISTNVWLNIAFFLIFLFFAFSFFGYYEITMPVGLTNKVSAAEGVGGILGIFFMALTLSLVSFSCTGPILGSLLAGALTSDGGAWQLTAGMSGFGLALALPFALFAMFPGWINKLPKSGGWLNTVKVVLGFLELALAVKFLSNADLVQHWGIVRYELFMIVWIVVAIMIALYLFGIMRFPHDSKSSKIAIGQKILGFVAVITTIYLALGLLYNKDTKSFNSLKLLSGLAPPAGYSWIYPSDCPNGLNCFKDLDAGLEFAKQNDKPILLDFTGYACVNCRKMEEHVWSDQRIFNLINEDYVLISLYVDDKKELPKKEQIEVTRIQGGKRKLRNYGHKWSHFQTRFFNTNSQPFYVLLNPDGTQMLNNPVGYTPSITEYESFLKCGLQTSDQLSLK